jgi:hypothetical protein
MKIFKCSLSLVIIPFFLSGMDVCHSSDTGVEEDSNALLGTVRLPDDIVVLNSLWA